ncbi:MAG TPA: hypothetical protein VFZ53_10625 [Polyangiaceae bacterium]
MVRGFFLVVGLGSFCFGCFPSLEGQSAGLTGCRESELEISDVDSSIGSETWIATCNGRRYVCSQPTMGPTAYNASCTAQNSGEERPTPSKRAPAPEESTAAAKKRSAPPNGAGGFQFGQSRDDVQSACVGGNFEFTTAGDNGARCSGLLANLPFKAAAQFSFCGETVCKIAIVVDTSELGATLLASYKRIDDALTKKYGKPAKRSTKLPARCSEDMVRECLKEGNVSLQRTWEWPTASVRLSLKQPDGAAEPHFVAIYGQAGEAPPEAL